MAILRSHILAQGVGTVPDRKCELFDKGTVAKGRVGA